MQPSEALGTAAQVAVTLAGFAGIVVVFRPNSVHQWSPLDKFRLQLLLANSTLPLVDSLFALLLLAFDPPPASIWRWCSGFGFTAQVLMAVSMRNPTQRFTRGDREAINKLLFYGIAVLGVVAMALQAINFSVWNLFWPFFALIAMHLAAALAQFVRMILLPPHESNGA
ncbi:MAG: hypothetical protein ACJ8KX_02155 [Chthoniobacterales bacterium]